MSAARTNESPLAGGHFAKENTENVRIVSPLQGAAQDPVVDAINDVLERSRAACRKRFATLQARAALAGVTVWQSQGDHGRPSYIATKWALTKEFADLDALDTWLARVLGGAR